METFSGYERADGTIGIRNHTLVMSVDSYSNAVVRNVVQQVDGVIPLIHQFGRGLRGEDGEIQQKTLSGIGRNPNVGGVIVVGFEEDRTSTVADNVADTGKPVEYETIEEQGTPQTITEVGRKARDIRKKLSDVPTVEATLSDLIVGVECGGSDSTSGSVSNPVTGEVVDTVIGTGGQAVFSETLEILGAEDLLVERAASPEVASDIQELVDYYLQRADEIGININDSNPSPDNKRGGLTTIEEKSIGAIQKAGTSSLQGILEYGDTPSSGAGLYFMDTPSPAQQSMTGLIAGGAQVILFSTGGGNPSGTPIAPVIKLSGNKETVEKMHDHIDVDVTDARKRDAGDSNDGHDKLLKELIAVADGKPVCAELLGHREFGIKRVGQSIL